jgi:uncharacterized protein YdeI (BOF family)
MIWFARPILIERWVVRKTSGLRNTLLLLFGATCLIAGGHSNPLLASVAPSTFVPVAPDDEPASASFAGKIVSQNGDRFILRDDANEVWYHLDDQAQAQRHFGKDVVVTGVLDGRSDMIHVRNILEVKP